MNDPIFKKRMNKLSEEQKFIVVQTPAKDLAKMLHVNLHFDGSAPNKNNSRSQNGPQNEAHGPRVK